MNFSTPAPPAIPQRQQWRIQNLWIQGVQDPPFYGYLDIHENKIVAAGQMTDSEKTIFTVDGQGFTAIPGMVNSHTHAAMSFFRDKSHGHPSMIRNLFFPVESSLTPDDIETLSYGYLLDNLLCGVTLVGEHFYFTAATGRALEALGMRGMLGEVVADIGGAFPGRQGWDRTLDLLNKWSFSSRLKPLIAPHATDTVSEKMLRDLGHLAKQQALPIHMHLAQTAAERRAVIARYGKSPVSLARDCGLLGEQTLAVHLLSVDEDDIKILADSGTVFGFCPSSELIYENLPPIDRLHVAGIPMALATDCAASNDSADLLGEMKIAGLFYRDRGYELSPEQLWHAVTTAPLQCFGLHQQLGQLKPGFLADVTFLKPSLNYEPVDHRHANLIFTQGSRAVQHVLIDGEWVLWSRQPQKIDIATVSQDYRQVCHKLGQVVADHRKQ